MHDDFGLKFYTDVTQSITYFTTKPGRNLLENDKTMLFQLRQPTFLGILSVDFTGSPLVAEMKMQTWRRTELLQMLGVTTIGSHSHVGSQALGEVRHRRVDVFLWHLFPGSLQGDFQLISCVRLQLEFMILFQHGAPDVIVHCVQIGRA